MAEQDNRFVDRIDDCGNVLDLLFESIVVSVTAFAPTPTIDRIDREVLREGGSDWVLPRVICGRTMDEHEQGPLPVRSNRWACHPLAGLFPFFLNPTMSPSPHVYLPHAVSGAEVGAIHRTTSDGISVLNMRSVFSTQF